jgi:hypothetical protein
MNNKFITAAILLASTLVAAAGSPLQIYVATDGLDTNRGTKNSPFRSVERARNELRRNRGKGQSATVFLRGGVYEWKSIFALDERDSNTTYKSYPSESVRIVGGKTLTGTVAVPISDAKTAARIIDSNARKAVLQIDLKKAGITDFGKMRPRGFRRPYIPAHLELFIDGKAMQMARWPNMGTPGIKIGKVLDRGSIPRKSDFTNRGGKFKFSTERPKLWTAADDVWISGLFNNGYADDTVKVKKFDLKNMTIRTVQPHMYGFNSGRPWNRWFALNLLEEIDIPGEFFCDTKNGMLYFYPPAGYDAAKSVIQISVLEEPMIALEGAKSIHIEGLTIECTRGMGVYIERGQDCLINGCTMRNIGMVAVCIGQGTEDIEHYAHQGTAPAASRRLGSWHEHIYANPVFDRHAGTNNGILSCDIYNIGAGAVHLGGGNRKTLVPAGNFVRNCDIHTFNRLGRSYKAGVNIDGVGNIIEHCNIHDAPATAIYLHGNNHITQYNEIHHVMLNGDDQGAWYMGRDPAEFGNIIKYNFFHHIGRSATAHSTWGIYYDDMACGTAAYGNIFYKVGKRADFLVGGGKYNTIINNIFIDSKLCVQVGNRGQTWAKGNIKKGGLFEQRTLKDVDITTPPYSTEYPKLANYWKDNPGVPDNQIIGNLAVNCGRITSAKPAWGTVKDNWMTKSDPGFANMNEGDFTLADDSAAYNKIPGFKPLPFSKMGLYKDDYRKQLPAKEGFASKIDISAAKPVNRIKINFQPQGSAIKGMSIDSGNVFSIHSDATAYGWSSDNSGSSRKRGKTADPLLDTLVHFNGNLSWKIYVEPGTYTVKVSIGDSEFPCQDQTVFVNGKELCSGINLKAGEFRTVTTETKDKNGFIILTSKNAEHGPLLTRMNTIEIMNIK